MTVKATIKVKTDLSGLRKLRTRMMKLQEQSVQTGFFDGKKHPQSGLTVGQVAAIQEFGTNKIPERPFITQSARGKAAQFELARQVGRYLRGEITVYRVYKNTGIVSAKEMKATIKDFASPPNAPRTVKKKGFNNPLIHTGAMLDSVTSRVRKQ